MKELMDILNKIKPGAVFEGRDDIFDSGLLSSMDIVMLASEISDEFDVDIKVTDIIPENFNSLNGMMKMIYRRFFRITYKETNRHELSNHNIPCLHHVHGNRIFYRAEKITVDSAFSSICRLFYTGVRLQDHIPAGCMRHNIHRSFNASAF